MSAFYSDNDPKVAAWLRELVKAEHLPKGTVDERSIQDLTGADLAGYRQVHLFAGIGGWPYALQLAGWPRSRAVWSGSCPCQPFSSAGKRKGGKDERHLWPAFFRLISECRPPVVFGEQVSGRAGYDWLARVSADLESQGYRVGAADLPAACVGAPHIRQRLFWVSNAASGPCERDAGAVLGKKARKRGAGQQYGDSAERLGNGRAARRLADSHGRDAGDGGLQRSGEHGQRTESGGACPVCKGRGWYLERFSDTFSTQCRYCVFGRVGHAELLRARQGIGQIESTGERRDRPAITSDAGGLGDSQSGGRGISGDAAQPGNGGHALGAGGTGLGWLGDTGASGQSPSECEDLLGARRRDEGRAVAESGGAHHWAASRVILCRDAKYRRVPVEPTLFPLAPRLPGRVGMLRGAGNAIVPQIAAAFVRAFLEAEEEMTR